MTPILPDLTCALAESPVWDDRRQCLFWVDITPGHLHCFTPETGRHTVWSFGEKISCIGLTHGPDLLVAGVSGVWRFDPTTEARNLWARFPDHGSGMRPNDGKVGPDGAFWVGTMQDRDDRGPWGGLFRFASDGSVKQMLGGLVTPNGLEWSPDGQALYLAETRALSITRFSFNPQSGDLCDPSPFVTLGQGQGKPDGAAVDAAGNYWVCGIYAGAVLVFTPSGDLVQEHQIGPPMVTMPCFGGTNFDTVYVTSLTRDADHAGTVHFAQLSGARGLPARRIRLT